MALIAFCTYIGIRIEAHYDRNEARYGVCRAEDTGIDYFLPSLAQLGAFTEQQQLTLRLVPILLEDFKLGSEERPVGAARPSWARPPLTGYSILSVLYNSSTDETIGAASGSTDPNCWPRACGSKTMLHVIMNYTNKPDTKFGMGVPSALDAVTYTNTENIVGLYAASSYGLLSFEPPPASRTVLLDMGASSSTGATFCNELISTETTRAISLLEGLSPPITNVSVYDVVEFILPGSTSCWFAVQAEQNGRLMWIDSPSLQVRVVRL